MALYEYYCEKCGKRIEKLMSVKQSRVSVVCSCGYAMRRTVSSSNFSLKGSGWAKDNYANKESNIE